MTKNAALCLRAHITIKLINLHGVCSLYGCSTTIETERTWAALHMWNIRKRPICFMELATKCSFSMSLHTRLKLNGHKHCQMINDTRKWLIAIFHHSSISKSISMRSRAQNGRKTHNISSSFSGSLAFTIHCFNIEGI